MKETSVQQLSKGVAMLSTINDAALTKVAEALGEEEAVKLIDILKNSEETTDDVIATTQE